MSLLRLDLNSSLQLPHPVWGARKRTEQLEKTRYNFCADLDTSALSFAAEGSFGRSWHCGGGDCLDGLAIRNVNPRDSCESIRTNRFAEKTYFHND